MNSDFFDVFRVSFDGLATGSDADVSMDLVHLGTGHINTDNRQSGSNASLQAAGNFHVTPQGNLILYAAEHDNDGPNASVKMLEYTNQNGNWRGDSHVGNAWIELFADANGWDNESETLQIELRDAVDGLHDLDNLNENDDWEDQPDGIAEFMPTAIDVTFYKDRNFTGDTERDNGTGAIRIYNLTAEPARKMSSMIFHGSSRVPSQWGGDTVYVDASFNGEPIGHSWGSPVRNLSHAMQIASAYGNITTIRVAGGTYKPTTDRRSDSFVIAGRSVTIQGGYEPGGSGTRSISQWPTILSGNIGSVVSDADDVYNVVTVIDAPNVTLDGLIIERGNANGGTDKTRRGGGIHIHDANVRLVNSIIRDCKAAYGGAVYNEATFRTLKSTLADNLATIDGGAIYNTKGGQVELDRSTLAYNTALDDGGGIFNHLTGSGLEVSRCTVHGNTASDKGGGLLNFAGGSAAIENSTIEGNQAATQGGGLWNSNNGSRMTVNLSSIVNNQGSSGGGVYSGPTGTLTAVNCLIAQNVTNDAGGQITGVVAGESNLITDMAMLAPLGDFGGDTMTCPPLPGSPAIEAADKTHPDYTEVDQIGLRRARQNDSALGTVGAMEALAFVGRNSNLPSNDGDSIPDILEGPNAAYPHLDPLMDDSALDSDGDGSPDAEEIGSMTDPFDPNSVFKILSLERAPGFHPVTNLRFIATIPTFPNMEYEIQSSDGTSAFRRIESERADGYTLQIEFRGRSPREMFRASRKNR